MDGHIVYCEVRDCPVRYIRDRFPVRNGFKFHLGYRNRDTEVLTTSTAVGSLCKHKLVAAYNKLFPLVRKTNTIVTTEVIRKPRSSSRRRSSSGSSVENKDQKTVVRKSRSMSTRRVSIIDEPVVITTDDSKVDYRRANLDRSFSELRVKTKPPAKDIMTIIKQEQEIVSARDKEKPKSAAQVAALVAIRSDINANPCVEDDDPQKRVYGQDHADSLFRKTLSMEKLSDKEINKLFTTLNRMKCENATARLKTLENLLGIFKDTETDKSEVEPEKAGTIFDNVLVADSIEDAQAHAAETFDLLKAAEKEQKEKADEEARKRMEEEEKKRKEEEEAKGDSKDKEEEEEGEKHDEL